MFVIVHDRQDTSLATLWADSWLSNTTPRSVTTYRLKLDSWHSQVELSDSELGELLSSAKPDQLSLVGVQLHSVHRHPPATNTFTSNSCYLLLTVTDQITQTRDNITADGHVYLSVFQIPVLNFPVLHFQHHRMSISLYWWHRYGACQLNSLTVSLSRWSTSHSECDHLCSDWPW